MKQLCWRIQRIRKGFKDDSSPGDPKAERQISYRKDTDAYRAQIESPEWQRAEADRRNFAVFSRNYINRIHCSGVIEDVLYPRPKAWSELKNSGHDLFLRMGVDVPAEFSHFSPGYEASSARPRVYQIDSVVDDQYPATNVELIPTEDLSAQKNIRYGTAIRTAEALPHEEQIARILRRVWTDDLMPFWRKEPVNPDKAPKGITPRQRIITGISDLVAWDLVVQELRRYAEAVGIRPGFRRRSHCCSGACGIAWNATRRGVDQGYGGSPAAEYAQRACLD